MDEGQFTLALSAEVEVDIATIDPESWKRIKEHVKLLLKNKQCDDIGKAYICAFLVYIQELSSLIGEYDPEKDKFM